MSPRSEPAAYRPLAISEIVRLSGATMLGRPALDVYLDGAVALHELMVPYSHGFLAGEEMYSRLQGILRSSQSMLFESNLITLGESLNRNGDRLEAVAMQIGDLAGQYVASDMPEGEDAARGAVPVRVLWPGLPPDEASRLDELRRLASSSQTAIQFEHLVIWEVLANVGLPGSVDIDGVIVELEGWAEQ